jgi:hypothetical protein
MDFRLSIFDCRMQASSGRLSSAHLNRKSKIENRKFTRSVVCLSLLITPIALLAACTAPHRTYQPPQDPSALDDTAFLHYLATVPTVTAAEGVRAVGLLLDPTPGPASFDDQRHRLEEVGAIKPTWRLEPDQTLDKGTLAFMLSVVCKTPRSLNQAVAAVTNLGDRRYALKTCIDEGLLPYGLPHDPVTGGELLSALSRAERYGRIAERDKP